MVRAFVVFVSVVVLLSADREGSSAPKTLEIRGGWWFNGQNFSRDRFYVVNGTLTRRRPAQVDSVLRLGDSYVVPPYADAHTHTLTDPGSIERRFQANKWQAASTREFRSSRDAPDRGDRLAISRAPMVHWKDKWGDQPNPWLCASVRVAAGGAN